MDSKQTELNLNPEQPQERTRRTIGHYEINTESYRFGAEDHDVSPSFITILF